jgi:hypothetical protein
MQEADQLIQLEKSSLKSLLNLDESLYLQKWDIINQRIVYDNMEKRYVDALEVQKKDLVEIQVEKLHRIRNLYVVIF